MPEPKPKGIGNKVFTAFAGNGLQRKGRPS
jgi:hypothetical protein